MREREMRDSELGRVPAAGGRVDSATARRERDSLPATAPSPESRVPSPDQIRSHFPALERRHNGRPVAYFDAPGGTQVPRQVVEAMVNYLYHHNANTHWAYPSSVETDVAIAYAREALADLLNASATEVAFGQNMTTLTFHLARAIGRELGPGDEIVITELDHHANVAPWRALATERGVTIREARLRPEAGQLDWDDLERQLSSRTKLLAIGAASNALGTISDVRRAVTMARAVGARVFVDAVHYVPHELTDVRAIDCDFLACSAYKFYGPHIGILYGKRDLLQSLNVPKLLPAPDTVPERLETGTQSHEAMVGAAAAVDFLASLADGPSRRARLRATFDALHARGAALLERMWNGLASIDGVRLFGPPPEEPRTPTVAFTVAGIPSHVVSYRLVDYGVFASSGDFYATTVVERLGHTHDGLVRAGCACYTTEDDVDRLVAGVRAIAAS
jgi:cysteine desulfurase family protein (TIGR01976 family)